MLCSAFCTASSYQLPLLAEHFKKRFKIQRFKDLIHIEMSGGEGEIKDAFCFLYGATLLWNFSKEEESAFLLEIKAFENEPLAQIESDKFYASPGTANQISDKQILLSNFDSLSRTAASHAMAQSVKLNTFELAIGKTIDSTRQIPEELAEKGKIGLKRGEIRRKMGALFLERHSINLHLDFLDKPEFFWEYEAYEPIYNMTAHYLDIQSRVNILNQKLKIVNELFQMMRDELNHQQSTRLEWVIIWLILLEVILTVLIDIFKIL
ncbi:MAG: hypothetical protein K0S07_59 [Chlamydiales bacterium]|jgi:uncharacterized Rmd1/YagE family protein|nr:hypothetical protein [Chlamydiales bacterium]